MRYLLMGKKDEALEHARALAAMDDSYLLPESPQKELMLEQRHPAYLSMLANSYLFKSLEITWRASDKDIVVVKNMVPLDREARGVLRLFLEGKGIEDSGT
jgi:hypothetical protein